MHTPQLSPEHRAALASAAITEDVINAANICTAHRVSELPESLQGWGDQVLPAIVFPHEGVKGECAPQIRPDKPIENGNGDLAKYLFAADGGGIFAVHPSMRDRVMNPSVPLVIVEGTKQHLAAVSALAEPITPLSAYSGATGSRATVSRSP